MTFQLRGVHVAWGSKTVLDHLTMTFPEGLNYLIGSNGSGKTTLMNCLARVGTYQGDIFLNEVDILTIPIKRFAQQVAGVPQQPQIQFRIRVWEFVLLGRFPYLNWLGNYQQADYDQAEQSLDALGLMPFKERFLDQLSGGEFQQVCLARALCQDTPVLLLDEPDQMLDPLHRIALYQMLDQLAAEGRTLICTTHNFEALSNSNACVSGIKAGKLIYQQAGGNSREQLMKTVFA